MQQRQTQTTRTAAKTVRIDTAAAAKAAAAKPLTEAEKAVRAKTAKVALGLVAGTIAAFALSSYIAAGTAAAKALAAANAVEGITADKQKQLEDNAALLSQNGFKAGALMVRDWGAIDGDAVIVNGAPALPLGAKYSTIKIGTGPVVLTAKAGSVGCVSLEVKDSTGSIYQVCVQDGAPIKTFAK